jgi:hypothetical protein
MSSNRISAPLRAVARSKAERRVQVDQQRQVGLQRDHQVMQAVHRFGQVAPGDALEDAGAVGEAVADHHRAARQRRADGLFQMVAAGGGEQQDLGFRRPAVGVALQHQPADFLGARAAARLARQDDVMAAARSVSASRRACVDLPDPSIPSNERNSPAIHEAGAAAPR